MEEILSRLWRDSLKWQENYSFNLNALNSNLAIEFFSKKCISTFIDVITSLILNIGAAKILQR